MNVYTRIEIGPSLSEAGLQKIETEFCILVGGSWFQPVSVHAGEMEKLAFCNRKSC